MNTDLKKTLALLERCLPDSENAQIEQIQKMYERTLLLQSQLLAVIYDMETFSAPARQERFAEHQSEGEIGGSVVILTIREPLPAMKKLTEATEEHWKDMLHAAIREAAEQGPLPHFEKAFVEIEVVTPRGTNNARVWDTSNRAIQVILNNLKGIFFRDDDMEHMAFSVVGRWGEGTGETIIRVYDFDRWQQMRTPLFGAP